MSHLDPSPEELAAAEARRLARQRKIDKINVIADGWVDGYLERRVTLENMIRGINAAAAAAGLSDKARESWLGYGVRRALDRPGGLHGKGDVRAKPQAFKDLARELVVLVHARERLSASREGGRRARQKTAYERVVEIFREAGVQSITPRDVEDWSSGAIRKKPGK